MKLITYTLSGLSKIILSLIMTLWLIGCATNPELQQKGPSNIRRHALKDTAATYGAQYGLAVEGQLIDRALDHEQASLNQIYNFNHLLLAHNVLPPVLIEGRNSLHIASRNTIHLADRFYTIVKPAQFVTTPPSWRDYLYLNFKIPEKPHFSLRPHTAEERAIWDEALVNGFKNGTRQAMLIFKTNLHLLHRDIEGMARYGILLAENMVTQPYVASTKREINGDSQHLRIGEKTVRITLDSGLVKESSTWRPALLKLSKQPDERHDCQQLTPNQPRQSQPCNPLPVKKSDIK